MEETNFERKFHECERKNLLSRKSAEVYGNLAATLSSIYLIPKILRVMDTKDAKEFTFMQILLLITASAMWVLFGIYLDLPAVWISNGITFLGFGIILYYKVINTFGDNYK